MRSRTSRVPRIPRISRRSRGSRVLNGALAALLAAAGLTVAAQQQAQATPPGSKDVTAVLFEWKFDSVAKECTDTLGPAGYGYVQVSPPQEHIQGSPVVDLVPARQLQDRRTARRPRRVHSTWSTPATRAGVKVVADAVDQPHGGRLRHRHRRHVVHEVQLPRPTTQVQDFDDCTRQHHQLPDRANVQNCELVGLADLDTGEDYVRGTIAGYLNDLLSLGVDGFRIDAAKHMPADRPRQHQVPADATRASTGSRRPSTARARPSSPASTPATATSRSSATPATSSGSSTTRSSPT